jgi:hypothetical protein
MDQDTTLQSELGNDFEVDMEPPCWLWATEASGKHCLQIRRIHIPADEKRQPLAV